MAKMVRIQPRIKAVLWRRLKAYAKAHGYTREWTVQNFLESEMDWREGKSRERAS